MPLNEIPHVATLEELYQRHKQHRMMDSAGEKNSEERLRHAWLLGADAVIGNLLMLLRDKKKDESLDSLVPKILEAWDAEILDRQVAKVMAVEAEKRARAPESPEEPIV